MYENVCLESVAACLRKIDCEVIIYKVKACEIDYEYIINEEPDMVGFSVEYCILEEVANVASNMKNKLEFITE